MYKNCPKCNVTWESKLTLPEDLFNHNKYESLDSAKEDAKKYYGWTEENDIRFSSNHIGIEIPNIYDGILCYRCENCKVLWNRFTDKEWEFK